VLGTRSQPQPFTQLDAFYFPAVGRKLKPSATRVVVDSTGSAHFRWDIHAAIRQPDLPSSGGIVKPFEINKRSANLELAAKITDSMVQDFGCRVLFNKDTGQINLVGDDYCKAVVMAVVNTMQDED
jgi:hypothetical protein